MTALATEARPEASAAAAPNRGTGSALRAEWIKLRTVRSTGWTLAATVVLGAGLTVLVCATSADWLASPEADESPLSFVTWGMIFAQLTAAIFGALMVTTEYGNGMIRSTFAAVPSRGRVIAAKAVLVAAILFVVGTVTAFAGYFGGNWFLDREGVGVDLTGDVLRSMFGSGLFLAGIGLFTVAVGFLVRHTAATISGVLALILIVGNMIGLIPGVVGDWLEKLMPGNAGSPIAVPIPFNPNLLGPWEGYGVFLAEIAVLFGLAWFLVRRRDA
jgi:ABC-2 type transport system permease protein